MPEAKTVVNDKVSNYNNEILMDKCQICNQNSEHTHHIKEQHCADSHGLIDSHVKKDEKGKKGKNGKKL